jgi:hypothetical protein
MTQNDNPLKKTSGEEADCQRPGSVTGYQGQGPQKGRPSSEAQGPATRDNDDGGKPPGYESYPFKKLPPS